jgi:predicted PurR-regulated permease PerM
MIVVAIGALVISMVDNLLRPLLLGEDAQRYPLMIFLSIVGGIMLFNFFGFILGPVITSLLFAVCKMYIDHYQHDIA